MIFHLSHKVTQWMQTFIDCLCDVSAILRSSQYGSLSLWRRLSWGENLVFPSALCSHAKMSGVRSVYPPSKRNEDTVIWEFFTRDYTSIPWCYLIVAQALMLTKQQCRSSPQNTCMMVKIAANVAGILLKWLLEIASYPMTSSCIPVDHLPWMFCGAVYQGSNLRNSQDYSYLEEIRTVRFALRLSLLFRLFCRIS